MTKELLKDIIEWDTVNWSQVLRFWEDKYPIKNKNYSCLELGARRGGLSLWLALNGNRVVCSDYNLPVDQAKPIHDKYECSDKVVYASIDATEIGLKNEFDVVAFKSILGGIESEKYENIKQRVIDEIYDSLKPGGVLLFAENMTSSFIHRFMRKYFVKWGSRWNYLKYKDIEVLLNRFSSIEFITLGFFAAFGRTEGQRRFLGKIDKVFKLFIPKSKRYIVIGIAKK
jgi:SAM-dependent methyltransferase